MFQLRTIGLDAFKLDGNLLGSDDVFSEVDLTEAAATDLTTDSVFVTDAKILEERLYQHTGLHLTIEGKPSFRRSQKREGQHARPTGGQLPNHRTLHQHQTQGIVITSS
jgi:hypothetical protein